MASERSSGARAVGWLFGLLAFLALLAAGAHLGEIERFWALLAALSPKWLLPALLLQALTYACVAAAWSVAIRDAGAEMRFRRLMPLALEKLFVDQSLPSGGVGGIAFLVAALAGRGLERTACMNALLTNLLGHYGANLMVAMAGIWLLSRHGAVAGWMAGVAGLFLLVSVAVPAFVLALRHLGGRWIAWLRRLPHVAALLDAFAQTRGSPLRQPRLLAKVTVLNAAVILLDAATLWVMLRALGQPVNYDVVLPSYLLAMMVATLGPIPVGLGTFEATCVAVLVAQHVEIEAALTGTMLLRGLTTWLPMLPGLILVRRELRRQRA